MLNKIKEISNLTQKGLKKIIADKGKIKIEEIVDKVKWVKEEMRYSPQNIEELFDMKEKLNASTSQQITDLSTHILQCRVIFEVLEKEQYQVEGEQLTRLWKLFCLPEELKSLKKSKLEELEKNKNVFMLELINQQTEFNDYVSNIENSIYNFSSFFSYKMIDEVFLKLNHVENQLLDLKDRTETFNKRENLLNRPLTDYSNIFRIEKVFYIYKDLWSVIDKWLKMRNDTSSYSKENFSFMINKLNGYLTYFNEKKTKKMLNLIEMIENTKLEIQTAI